MSRRKRSCSRTGWKAGWLKKGGDETVKSLVSIFHRVKEEKEVLKQWKNTAIKSIYKGAQKKC